MLQKAIASLSALLLLLLLAGVVSPTPTSDIARIKSAKLHLRRVTSSDIVIYFPCESDRRCRVESVQYKAKSQQTHDLKLENTTEKMISSLRENTLYEILAVVEIETSNHGMRHITSNLTAKTCPKPISPVNGLRVVQAGPGWIDIRWNPVVETKCYSDIFYLVNYYNSEWLRLGLFQANNTAVFRPSHPCEAWPGEFCALLTDHVEPGKTHSIKINPVRYRVKDFPPENFPPAIESKSATSNAHISGSYDFGAKDAYSPCAPRRRPPPPEAEQLNPLPEDIDPDEARSDNSDISLPVFGLAAAGLILIGVIVFVIIAVYCKRKRQKRECGSIPIRGIDPSQANDRKHFDPNRPLPTPRVSNIYDNAITPRESNIYDDCRDAPRGGGAIYEPLREPSPRPKHAIAPHLIQGSGSTSNENYLPNDVYVPMGPPPPVYDDAEGTTQIGESRAFRQSENYECPRRLPTYDEIMDTHSAGPVYNRPYSTFADGKWKAWN